MNLPNVKNIIAVASGKGGVGKSTVSANLAAALAKGGAKVGLMDADVYGPSIPALLGITDRPETKNDRVHPVERYGIKVISTHFFVPPHEAVIWRGPMLNKMIQDFLSLVEWGDLDYLLVDLPPGTGDVQLSLCQSIALTGAVVVSTPQDVAWNVAQKAIVMFDKLNTPVLGIVENMASHACSNCGHEEEIFGKGGAKAAAGRLGIPFLGSLPLVRAVRETSDAGQPIVLADPSSAAAGAFVRIAENLKAQASESKKTGGNKLAPIQVSPPGQPEITILWNDGKSSRFAARDLRLLCPCAACVNEVTGERTLRPETVPADVKASTIGQVGRYAIYIVWSDGHNTGLYGFDYLRRHAR